MIMKFLPMVLLLLAGCAAPMPAAMSKKSVVFRPCFVQVATCGLGGCIDVTREAMCQGEEMIIIRREEDR